jgi:MYXO-CTERM domain-containing protein
VAASRFPRYLIRWFAAALLAGCVGGATESNPPALSAQATNVGPPWVDRPGLSHAPARNAAGTATVQYFGGTVTANAKVYVVWWGNPANINSAVTAAHGGIADFFAGVTNSSFMDWLNEYSTSITVQAGSHMGSAGTGQHIGRGNYAGTLTLSSIPSGNVTDAQIQSTLDQAFVAGTLPPPDDNTLYAIYFPSSVTISLGGSSSCSSFGAYHEAIIETTRHNAYYLVMPDCGSSFNGMTSVSTHELVEAMTDNIPTPANSPNYPQSWNDSMGSEVGDLCGSSSTVTTPLGMFTVQNIWDERTQACKAFSSDANDFNVAISPNVAMVALGATSTFTVQTATTTGSAQTLTLSATGPTGVTATVSPTTITSGATATLTVTATNPSTQSGLQVVVRADAATTHTAALLLSTNGSPADLGPAAPDLAQAAADLAHPGGDDASSPSDLSLGTGGGGPPTPKAGGCGCVIGAPANASALDNTWTQATLFLLAFGLVALRRRKRRA